MNYYLWTIGCQMNDSDSQRVASELEKLGYRYVNRAEEADIVVLNTCVVRQQAEDKIYGRLGSLKPLKARRPELIVGLMGCLVGVRDSGPLHIANSVGTEVIGLFGPTRPEVTGPKGFGKMHIIQHDVGCNKEPCYHLDCPDNICMQSIITDDVLDIVKQIKDR